MRPIAGQMTQALAEVDRNGKSRYRFALIFMAGLVGGILMVSPCAAVSAQIDTVLYIGKHFEVRDHGQPTKYVFNGGSRVAAIIGSISANQRLQRLRLFAGWNLCSLAVTGPFPAAGADAISAAYQWNAGTVDYSAVVLGQTLAAGSVLWINSRTNAVVPVLGNYSDPTERQVQAGGSYVPGSGLEAWTPALPGSVVAWNYDTAAGQWLEQLTGALVTATGPLPSLSPGGALYLQAGAPVLVDIPAPALRVRYYHSDHLGSSSAITDANGLLLQEAAFYPFGHNRNLYRAGGSEEPYQFVQKERERESGLDYFGKRFYASGLGKWLTPDPMLENGGSLNLYSYVKENPLRYQDPDGGEIKMNYEAKTRTLNIEVTAVLVDASSHHFSQDELKRFAADLEKTIDNSYSGSGSGTLNGKKGKFNWTTTVHIQVLGGEADLGKLALGKQGPHVFRIVDRTAHRSAGDSKVGGMLVNITASDLLAPRPDQVDYSNPANKDYRRYYNSPEGTGAHEYGHTGGLPDEEESKTDLMSHGREYDSKQVTLEHIDQMWREYRAGHLNQPDDLSALQPKKSD